MTVLLVNPLRHALAHYAAEVRHVLPVPSRLVEPGVERADGAAVRRLAGQVAARRVRVGTGSVLVLWPAFGRFDPITWAGVARRRPVHVVVHDPEPLRPQHGHGRGAALAERAARAAGVGVVVHSEPARLLLLEQGWAPMLLPHPVLPPAAVGRNPDGPVVVLGQHKPTRSLEPLAELGRSRALDGRRLVCGRGWPQVSGWEVRDGFLDEDRFDATLRSARCLVVPYDRYYQSGVAVRAVEAGIPVIARSHPFLVDLLGAGWVGFADDGDWSGAVERVSTVADEQLAGIARAAERRAREAWASVPWTP